MVQMPAPPQSTAEPPYAMFKDSDTPVKPASQFKIQKAAPPEATLVSKQRTGRLLFK